MIYNSRHRHVYDRGATRRCYNTWFNMHRRCYDKKFDGWKHYGGRGIAVCARWHRSNPEGFLNFFLDMGNPPDNLSLDRIDVDKGYEHSNCRWATSSEQLRSRRKVKALANYSIDEIAEHVRDLHEREQLQIIKHMLRKKKT